MAREGGRGEGKLRGVGGWGGVGRVGWTARLKVVAM